MHASARSYRILEDVCSFTAITAQSKRKCLFCTSTAEAIETLLKREIIIKINGDIFIVMDG